MRARKIGLFAVQETHLTAEHVDELEEQYRHLHIINSELPENPTGAGGVAIVLNKLVTNTKGVRRYALVRGRALMVSFEWHRGRTLTVLAVYAPTDKDENEDMWSKINTMMRSERITYPRPDVVLGDFNFVEDSVDRFPAKLNRIDNPGSFKDLKRTLKLRDGWRSLHPGESEWTWRDAQRRSMSRIDRIYMAKGLEASSADWRTEFSGITRNDHSRVSATIYALDGPDVGRGRWAMRESLTRDEAFLRTVDELIKAANTEMVAGAGVDGSRSCQTIWKDTKTRICKAARQRTRDINCRRRKRMEKLEAEREDIKSRLAGTDGWESGAESDLRDELRRVEDAVFEEKTKVQGKVFGQRATRAWAEGETMSKSWFRWPSERRKCEEIPFLRPAGGAPGRIVESSKAMAKLARDYHDDIQSRDLDVDPAKREGLIEKALGCIQGRLSGRDRLRMSSPVDREEVAEAIRQAKNGKAAGTDGIIHELWKELDSRFRKPPRGQHRWSDIAGVLARVFNDIEERGVEPDSGFTEGWMCPLYKKGERSDISNYRPITLLNTDYKLFTKSLASRLAIAAQYLVHGSQAGFVRGRSITDHIKITMLMLDYAEAKQEDGAIIALDQEKAYDRVRHDYMLRVLETYGFPPLFVDTVRRLYEDANTRVMVNGELSEPFRVTRGVRQGDPLSCLLFNLAIEPLSAMLRASELEGYAIDGVAERLIATLYADDTTVYLSANDSYETLSVILEEWCVASGARFNIKKTEVIPIGSEGHRSTMVETRTVGPTGERLPAGVRVARDGEVTRILGAWPGNGVKNAAVWSTIESKVVDRLDAWERTKPTLAGRAIITQVVIGGCTQYLTAAQGMPLSVAKGLDKIALDFIWQHSKRHPVNMETIRLPKKDGGLNAVHIQARNDAQYLTWVSSFLAPKDRRPLWAFIAESIFAAHTILEHRRRVPREQWGNPFFRDYRANPYALPFMLQQMVRVADKYQLVADDPMVPTRVREEMHVWTHPAMLDGKFLHDGRKRLRCLRVRHAVRTVEDLEEIAEIDDPEHDDSSDCGCENCATDRGEGCLSPHRCQAAAEDLLGMISERWNTSAVEEPVSGSLWTEMEGQRQSALEQGEMLVFDHRPPSLARAEDLCRVFVDSRAIAGTSAAELARSRAGRRAGARGGDPITAAACAGLARDENGRMRGGFAVHFPALDAQDRMHSYGGDDPTYDRCAALAVVAACSSVAKGRTLHILTTSKLTVRALTTDLERNEGAGWAFQRASGDALRLAAAALRARAAETSLTYISRDRVRGWPEVATARTMAQVAALCSTEMRSPRSLRNFDRPGRSALGMSQRAAHTAIRERDSLRSSARTATGSNLAQMQGELETVNGYPPPVRQIWKDIQDRSISRQARNFLWKGIHGAHKVGDYFKKMPEPWRSMATCPTCGTIESMEHILFSCPDSGQDTVWKAVKWTLRRKQLDVDIGIGLVWGCASFSGSPAPGANRAFRIVVSEAAFLIWKIRCERRIEHGDDPDWSPSVASILSRWKAVMRQRRAHDARMSSPRLFGNRALNRAEVLATWRDTANLSFFDLYRNRARPGVLVGSGVREADGIG